MTMNQNGECLSSVYRMRIYPVSELFICAALTVLRQLAGRPSACSSSIMSVALNVAESSAFDVLETECAQYGFRSADLLLRVMKRGKVVASGSLVLKILRLSGFETSDIDFYMAQDRGPDNVLLEFLYICGYTLQTQPSFVSGMYASSSIICDVLRLVRTEGNFATSVNVVFVASPDDVFRAVLEFHSTLVMNIVSWYGILCLYPRWTLLKLGLIVRETHNTWVCFKKYEGRGFQMFRTCLEDYPAGSRRSMHDGSVLVIPFAGMNAADVLLRYVPDITWTVEPTPYLNGMILCLSYISLLIFFRSPKAFHGLGSIRSAKKRTRLNFLVVTRRRHTYRVGSFIHISYCAQL